jgi:hypothetical protein
MKYLSKRDDFLRVSKINEKSDFIRKSKSGLQAYELITEDGGPGYNTTGWNDSGLGRIINHMIRKAKVQIGKARIRPVVRSLYDEFERIKAQGVLVKAGDDVMKIAFKIAICVFIDQLRESIKDGDDHSEILGLTEATIEHLEDIDIEDIPEKDKLLSELEELKKFLISLGIELKTTDEEEEEEEGQEEGQEEEEEVKATSIDVLYPTMVENLKALSSLLKINAKAPINTQAKVPATTAPVKTPTTAVATAESIIFEAAEDPQIEKLEAELKKAQMDPKKNANAIDILKKSIEGIKKRVPATTTPTQNGVSDEDIKKAILKLKESIANLVNPKIKIAVNTQLIDAILAQGDQYKDEIIKLYTEINSFLFGIKAKTLNYEPNKLNELYKGTGKNLIGNNVDSIAEKIAKFYKRAAQFEMANLYTGIGEVGTSLKSFVDTMKKINTGIKPAVKVAEKPSVEEPVAQNSSILMSYNKFLKINEEIEESDKKDDDLKKEEGTEDKSAPGEVATGSTSEKIRDFWDRKCKTTKNYVMDKAEVDKVNASLEKIKDNTDNFVIDGLDPIINIVRLFNRAYKIFTVSFISRRKEGAGASTLAEYTPYGTGNTGPYRNNKIFNIWEDAVLKILGDTKYQYIFSKDTKLRMPIVPSPKKPEDYEYRENAGANLRRFMTDILNGEQLYKISGSGNDKGAQSTFLASYFGEPDAKTEGELGKDTSFTLDKEDGVENSKNSAAIDKNALHFSKINNKEISTNQFFVVNCNTIDDKGVESKPTYRFFHISEKTNNDSYLAMCNTFFFFGSYLEGKKVEKGDGIKTFVNQAKFTDGKGDFKSYFMKYTSTKNDIFNSLLTPGSKFEIKYVGSDAKSADTEKIKVIDAYWLAEKDKDGKYTVPYTAKDLTQEFLNKKITSESNKVKNVVAHIKNANNTSIKKI